MILSFFPYNIIMPAKLLLKQCAFSILSHRSSSRSYRVARCAVGETRKHSNSHYKKINLSTVVWCLLYDNTKFIIIYCIKVHIMSLLYLRYIVIYEKSHRNCKFSGLGITVCIGKN